MQDNQPKTECWLSQSLANETYICAAMCHNKLPMAFCVVAGLVWLKTWLNPACHVGVTVHWDFLYLQDFSPRSNSLLHTLASSVDKSN